MSMISCSTCDHFRDSDTDNGEWDVPRINSTAKLDYVCGVCAEKYLTEDGQFDPDLEDREAGTQISEAQRHMEEGP